MPGIGGEDMRSVGGQRGEGCTVRDVCSVPGESPAMAGVLCKLGRRVYGLSD